MDFNKITIEMEKEAVAKFKEFGRGVIMGKYIRDVSQESQWAELIDPILFNEYQIKQKMLDVARTINTSCNDEFLGVTNIAFKVTTDRDEVVTFTFEDIYLFLRAVLRYRRDTAEYKAKKARKAELERFVEDSKSKKEKLKEAREELKAISDSLD